MVYVTFNKNPPRPPRRCYNHSRGSPPRSPEFLLSPEESPAIHRGASRYKGDPPAILHLTVQEFEHVPEHPSAIFVETLANQYTAAEVLRNPIEQPCTKVRE